MEDVRAIRRRGRLQRSLRANQDFGFVYLNNSKAGCSTFKAALWTTINGAAPDVQKLRSVGGASLENDPRHLGWAETAFVFCRAKSSRIAPKFDAYSHVVFAGWVQKSGRAPKTGGERVKLTDEKAQRAGEKVKRNDEKVKRVAEKVLCNAQKAKRAGKS